MSVPLCVYYIYAIYAGLFNSFDDIFRMKKKKAKFYCNESLNVSITFLPRRNFRNLDLYGWLTAVHFNEECSLLNE